MYVKFMAEVRGSSFEEELGNLGISSDDLKSDAEGSLFFCLFW